MKKILFGLTLVLLMTGCIPKSVICSSESAGPNAQGLSLSQKYTLSYDKDKVTKVVALKEFTFNNDAYFKQFGTVIDSSKSSILELDNKAISYDVKEEKNLYETKLSAKMADLKEEELKALGFEASLKDFQVKLEEQGLICK